MIPKLNIAPRTTEQAIEKAKANEAWMKNYYEIIWNWLRTENSKYESLNQKDAVWNVILS